MGSLNTQNILIIIQAQDVCIHFVLTTNKVIKDAKNKNKTLLIL